MTIIEDANKYLHEKPTAYMTKERRLEKAAVLIEKLVKEIEMRDKVIAMFKRAIGKRKILHDPQCERYTYLNEICTCGLDEALSQLEDK